MENICTLNSLDEALMDSAKSVKPLYYIEPTNIKEQKKEFLSGRVQNPSFTYRDLEYEPQKVAEKLESIDTPEDELGAIFGMKKRNALLENRIIANRGDEDIVKEATGTIYGSPSDELVSNAAELLMQIPNVETAKTATAEMVRDALQESLYENGIIDWTVKFSNKRLTTVYAAEKKITVCKNRKFREIDPERLKVHEVGHVLRAANGYEQPLKIFALGLPGYSSTEEGLSTYFEEQTGNSSEEILRDYAARVIAVDSVCQGLNFRQSYDRLKCFDLTDNQAWNTTVRAYRAGGYIKDHVYLEGLKRVREFSKNDGDFDTLYVGKVGIEDLPLVRKLLQEGTLKKAKYKPNFIN